MPKLGQWVRIKAFLERKASPGVDVHKHHVRLKTWERHECTLGTRGIYVGSRQKSNGSANSKSDEGYGYKPIAYFEVWLVAYAANRDILVCLPSDVKLEPENDKDHAETECRDQDLRG